MNHDNKSAQTVLIVGATGYIGRAVVAESVRQGYDVIAVTRSPKKDSAFDGAEVVVADVADPASIAKLFERKVDVVISCLATRSGLPRDFDDIDYKATLNVLNAAQKRLAIIERREHDHGDLRCQGVRAQTGADGEPIHARHHHIQQDHIGKVFKRQLQCALAVFGDE